MSLVVLLCLASLKGSPGVTTIALVLAARWPRPWQRLLVEADPAGGDLAARFGLPLTPGLVSLAAAARRSTDPGLLWAHAQTLPGGLIVVPGPTGPDQAHAALATIRGADGRAGVFGSYTGRADVVVVADCGRLDRDAPTPGLMKAADQLLLVARPRVDQLAHVAAWVAADSVPAARTRLLLVGDGYPAAEVSREVGLPVVALFPDDPRTAATLTGRGMGTGKRSRLVRAATRLATELAADLRRHTEPSATHTDATGAKDATAGIGRSMSVHPTAVGGERP